MQMNEEISKEEASALVGMFGYDIIIVLNVRRISTDQDLLDAFSSGKDKSWLVYERLTEAVAHKIPRAASMVRVEGPLVHVLTTGKRF